MFFSVDKTEGAIVVLVDESGDLIETAADRFDVPPAEGQIVALVGDRYVYDPEETAARRAEVLKLIRGLFGKK